MSDSFTYRQGMITTLGTQNKKRWVGLKHIQDVRSLSKTTVHRIVDDDENPDALIKFGCCLRICKDALIRWIKRQRYSRDYDAVRRSLGSEVPEPSERPKGGL
jgi:hypothetical protein